jgi:hypothetical protein
MVLLTLVLVLSMLRILPELFQQFDQQIREVSLTKEILK